MNILIIDDDSGCLDSLSSSLQLYSHNCEAHTNAVKAVEIYRENPSKFDLIITDMKMPVMSGIEVLQKALQINKEAKVIIITAYGDVETAILAVNNHAYAFFGKPINFQELLETIERIENEKNEKKLTKEEQTRLIDEYAKLKKAFEELQTLLGRDRSKTEGGK
ncbi:MAG TPA: response regulator [Candidatus Wallbacteria bacterium]|nr:MAG: Transcriptional regulatory protein ZraR [bacterium ADurb.Bin243]HPG56271.1 response regulator [Candidatus Wallbacteria bacterium]